jgi:hypothetical protein
MNQKTTTGKTPFQKFNALAKGLIRIPKTELDAKIRDVRKQKQQKPKQ